MDRRAERGGGGNGGRVPERWSLKRLEREEQDEPMGEEGKIERERGRIFLRAPIRPSKCKVA